MACCLLISDISLTIDTEFSLTWNIFANFRYSSAFYFLAMFSLSLCVYSSLFFSLQPLARAIAISIFYAYSAVGLNTINIGLGTLFDSIINNSRNDENRRQLIH